MAGNVARPRGLAGPRPYIARHGDRSPSRLTHAACRQPDQHAGRRLRARARVRLHRGAPEAAGADRLSRRRRPHRTGDAGLRRRRRDRGPAGRDRRHAADVRRRPALLARRPAGRAQGRAARRRRADGGGHRARRGRWRCCWGWSARRGARLRARAVGREHRRAAEGAREPRRRSTPANGRIAVGWLVVEDLAMVLVLVLLPPLAGALGGQPAHGRPGSDCWPTLGHDAGRRSAVFVALDAGRRPARSSRGCCGR